MEMEMDVTVTTGPASPAGPASAAAAAAAAAAATIAATTRGQNKCQPLTIRMTRTAFFFGRLFHRPKDQLRAYY
jgi:hypothetical protein